VISGNEPATESCVEPPLQIWLAVALAVTFTGSWNTMSLPLSGPIVEGAVLITRTRYAPAAMPDGRVAVMVPTPEDTVASKLLVVSDGNVPPMFDSWTANDPVNVPNEL